MTNLNKRRMLPYGSEAIRNIYRSTCNSIAGGGMYGESHKQQLAAVRRSVKHTARQLARKHIKFSIAGGEE